MPCTLGEGRAAVNPHHTIHSFAKETERKEYSSRIDIAEQSNRFFKTKQKTKDKGRQADRKGDERGKGGLIAVAMGGRKK